MNNQPEHQEPIQEEITHSVEKSLNNVDNNNSNNNNNNQQQPQQPQEPQEPIQQETSHTVENPLNNIGSNGKEQSPEELPEASNSVEKPLNNIPPDTGNPSSNDKEDEYVNTLLELPMDYATNLLYYYPYFYKTHLISLAGDINFSTLVTICSTPKCDYCTRGGVCMRCQPGYILSGQTCVAYCPDGFIADNLRLICVSSNSNIIVTK